MKALDGKSIVLGMLLMLGIGVAFGFSKKTSDTDSKKNKVVNVTHPDDATPKVTGIGGIFFYSDDPKVTNEWYTKNLGIEINEWGSSSFEFRNRDKPKNIGSLQWKPFKKGSNISHHPKKIS